MCLLGFVGGIVVLVLCGGGFGFGFWLWCGFVDYWCSGGGGDRGIGWSGVFLGLGEGVGVLVGFVIDLVDVV